MTKVKYNPLSGNFDLIADINDVSPLEVKGDLMVHNGTASVRFPVGADTTVLVADSSEESGVKWKSLSIPFVLADGTATGISLRQV